MLLLDLGPTGTLTHTLYRLAKEKRERLRHAQLAPDYIPLHSVTRTSMGISKKKAVGASTLDALNRGGLDGEVHAEPAAGSDSDQEPEEVVRLKFTADTVSRCINASSRVLVVSMNLTRGV